MNDAILAINKHSWADWSIGNINIDFEEIRVSIHDYKDKELRILCKDYIGIRHIGHWDESIIESMEITDKGPLIDDSINEVKNKYEDDGEVPFCNKHVHNNWYQLNIKLIDEIVISIACKSFEIIDSE